MMDIIYTGLKDKNGVEVCDGDIVTYINPWNIPGSISSIRIGAVVWDEKRLQWGIQLDSGKPDQLFACLEIEVVGNIHENLDLLEDQ